MFLKSAIFKNIFLCECVEDGHQTDQVQEKGVCKRHWSVRFQTWAHKAHIIGINQPHPGVSLQVFVNNWRVDREGKYKK